MKIRNTYSLQTFGEHHFIVRNDGKKVLHSVNETGALLWNRLSSGAEFEDLMQEILREYAVEEQELVEDIQNFLDMLETIGALER